jgi:hypothetical protein
LAEWSHHCFLKIDGRIWLFGSIDGRIQLFLEGAKQRNAHCGKKVRNSHVVQHATKASSARICGNERERQVADNSMHTIINFDSGQMPVPAVPIGGFMWNQGHLLPRVQRPQCLNLNNQRKIPRTELVSARSSRPLSNTNEHDQI